MFFFQKIWRKRGNKRKVLTYTIDKENKTTNFYSIPAKLEHEICNGLKGYKHNMKLLNNVLKDFDSRKNRCHKGVDS